MNESRPNGLSEDFWRNPVAQDAPMSSCIDTQVPEFHCSASLPQPTETSQTSPGLGPALTEWGEFFPHQVRHPTSTSSKSPGQLSRVHHQDRKLWGVTKWQEQEPKSHFLTQESEHQQEHLLSWQKTNVFAHHNFNCTHYYLCIAY